MPFSVLKGTGVMSSSYLLLICQLAYCLQGLDMNLENDSELLGLNRMVTSVAAAVSRCGLLMGAKK